MTQIASICAVERHISIKHQFAIIDYANYLFNQFIGLRISFVIIEIWPRSCEYRTVTTNQSTGVANMETKITYNVCRDTLGDDITDAQYGAFKNLVQESIKSKFPDAIVSVGDSDFCNASTCSIDQHGLFDDDTVIVNRDDVEQAVSNVGEGWWDAE